MSEHASGIREFSRHLCCNLRILISFLWDRTSCALLKQASAAVKLCSDL